MCLRYLEKNPLLFCLTIGDALKRLRGHQKEEMSRAITFITGPSRA